MRVLLGVGFVVTAALLWACGGDNSAANDGGADGHSSSGGDDSGSGGDSSHPGPDSGGGNDGGYSGSDSGGVAPINGVRLFYTDLESGPNSGGENAKGAYVTLYGNGFGATQGTSTVTIGAGKADNYPIWGDTRITLQLGAAAATGDVVVHVANKGDSNALAFTVRTGNIFFVSSTGSDMNDGSFAKPWATIPQAKNSIKAGDIAYIGTHAGDMVSQTAQDQSSPYNCALGMSVNDGTNAGTAGMPKALVAYPGATALIGDPNNLERGILTPGISGTFDYWVVAGLTLRGQAEALEFEGSSLGWRVVGNDISCPNGSGLTGCVTGGNDGLRFYGNVVHDAAANVSQISKYYHAVYFAGNHLDLGWNVVRDGKTCRAIQFHNTGGTNEYDLHVHDNLIHGTVCDGINFATVDPSQGTVEAYNNVLYAVGTGPDPVEASSDYAGVYVAGETDMGAPGGGTVEVFNNTLYDCGSWTSNSAAGAFNNSGGNPALAMHLVNNVVYAKSGESYLAPGGTASLISGSNNLLFGGGAPPMSLTASVTMDPGFVDASMFDFHLAAASSPAVGAGTNTKIPTDFDGFLRPSGAYAIGAYEYHGK